MSNMPLLFNRRASPNFLEWGVGQIFELDDEGSDQHLRRRRDGRGYDPGERVRQLFPIVSVTKNANTLISGDVYGLER